MAKVAGGKRTGGRTSAERPPPDRAVRRGQRRPAGVLAGRAALLAGIPMLALLAVPVVALITASSWDQLVQGVRDESFLPALWLSARTTFASMTLVILGGTPLAWWMSAREGRWARAAELVVDLPIVVPPAVVGLALLEAFGRNGFFGPVLATLGLHLPFTTAAVVMAQVVVAAPFYVQSAAAAFRRTDADLLVVARTLGQSPAGAFVRVAAPLALPGLVTGAALSWARALGEFGATLLFAGNLAGSTRTMPLAIYTALEADTHVAVSLALALVGAGTLLLLPLRAVPAMLARRFGVPAKHWPHGA